MLQIIFVFLLLLWSLLNCSLLQYFLWQIIHVLVVVFDIGCELHFIAVFSFGWLSFSRHSPETHTLIYIVYSGYLLLIWPWKVGVVSKLQIDLLVVSPISLTLPSHMFSSLNHITASCLVLVWTTQRPLLVTHLLLFIILILLLLLRYSLHCDLRLLPIRPLFFELQLRTTFVMSC